MRFFLIALFIHLAVFSFVWVGFSVPKGSEQNSFTYLGNLLSSSERISRDNGSNALKSSDAKMFDEPSSAFFAPWLEMRQVEKPR